MDSHHMQNLKTFDVGIASSPESTHPQITEDLLRARVRQQSTVVTGESQTHTRLPGPVGQLARQKLLC